MNFNIGDFVFTNNKNNQFHSKFKENIRIAEEFKGKIRDISRTKAQSVLKNYQPTDIVFLEDKIIIGDKGGFVLSINN